MVNRPLLRLALRHGRLHAGSTLLLIFGIALGVSVVISVELAGKSVSRSFELTTEALYGRATHQITGSGAFFSPEVYRRLRVEMGVFASTPVIEGRVAFEGREGTVRMLGIDPFSVSVFRPESELGDGLTGGCFPQGEGVMISRAIALHLGVSSGDFISLVTGERKVVARVRCVTDRGILGLSELVVADLAFASDLMGSRSDLSRIDLILKGTDQAEALSASLPDGVHLTALEDSMGARRALSEAFETNLTAFSVLALFMGMFLVYSTVSFSVHGRLTQVGVLRVLGASPRDLFFMVVGETGVYALLGSAAGIVLGTLLGRLTVGLVTITVSELYYELIAPAGGLSIGVYAKGVLFGCLAAFLAALLPAFAAASEEPVTVIAKRSVGRISPLASGGAGMALLSLGALPLTGLSSSLSFAFSGLFLLLAGAALLVPLMLVVMGRLISPLVRGLSFGVRSAVRRTAGRPAENALTVATLMVVIAATLGIGLMTGSFRTAVSEWIHRNIRGDLQLATSVGSGRNLPDGVLASLGDLSAVASILPYTIRRVQWGKAEETLLFSYDGPMPEQTWVWRSGGQGVFVSEVFARHAGVTEEDPGTISFETAKGEQRLPVVGVFSDFFSGTGRVILPRRLYESLWSDTGHTSLQIFLADGANPAQVAESLRGGLAQTHGLLVREGPLIRQETLRVFDRTFRIAGALQLLIALTAVVGVFSAFTARVSGRYRETGVLRALGVAPSGIRRLFFGEFLLLALLAVIFALPLGVGMAIYLIDVINARSFGWSYDLIVSGKSLIACLLLPFAAAIPAGLIPAVRASRTDIREALQAE